MNSSATNDRFHQLTAVLDGCHPASWDDIHALLDRVSRQKKPAYLTRGGEGLNLFSKGTAFITFAYGIDGVSIEISKYARILHDLYAPAGKAAIHLIGGKFASQAKSVLDPELPRCTMRGINGWDKWNGGKWFEALFRTDMKPGSPESTFLAGEIYRQAVSIAKRLGRYFVDHQISLVVPVNVASNPGNFALTLGLVLVTELFGTYVLNSNHDFYWEDGNPATMRRSGEEPGGRDHFFRNIGNESFFTLLKALYPWNGSRWLQLTINARQSRKLINRYGLPEKKVFVISTCLSDSFFDSYSREDVLDVRLRMGHILSDGQAIMRPVPVDDHLSNIDGWMQNQRPVILASRPGLSVDPQSEDLIILLQPTRIVSRKRIPRDLRLIGALLRGSVLRDEFENNPNRQLILHITGPTPREHQVDLVRVLRAYRRTVRNLPETLADRVFLAFSAGRESQASFAEKGLEPLTIESIYRMADAVVFPSESEGRGLPIIEASASGIPIICSQYRPREVFYDVIGEHLPEDLRIRYTLFPDGNYTPTYLTEVADLLINRDYKQDIILHNKDAVRARYSTDALKKRFERLLKHLGEID